MAWWGLVPKAACCYSVQFSQVHTFLRGPEYPTHSQISPRRLPESLIFRRIKELKGSEWRGMLTEKELMVTTLFTFRKDKPCHCQLFFPKKIRADQESLHTQWLPTLGHPTPTWEFWVLRGPQLSIATTIEQKPHYKAPSQTCSQRISLLLGPGRGGVALGCPFQELEKCHRRAGKKASHLHCLPRQGVG